MRKMTDEQLLKLSLAMADRLYYAGSMGYEDWERHYHLWRSNPHLLGFYPPCRCGECQIERGEDEVILYNW